jgi:hypothetical protein
MAHPAAAEFASQLDSGGIFIRRLLKDSLSSSLPDAYIYDPSSAPPIVLENANQRISNGVITAQNKNDAKNKETVLSSSIEKTTFDYPPPFSSLYKARTAVINCITKLQAFVDAKGGGEEKEGELIKSTVTSEVSASISSVDTHPLDADVEKYIQARSTAGYNSLWGTIEGRPLLVEEDAAVLLSSGLARAGEGGWESVEVDVLTDADPPAYIQVAAQVKSDLAVRPHMASIVMTRHGTHLVRDALDALPKYSQWDLSWATAKEISKVDPFNQVAYFVGDPPPPPFSFLFPQRDFVLFRLVANTPRETSVVVRTGGHAKFDPALIKDYEYVRGEVVGTVGFAVRPFGTPPSSLRAVTNIFGVTHIEDVSTAKNNAKSGGDGGDFERFLPSFWPLPPVSARPSANTAAIDKSSAVLIYSAGDPKGNVPSFVINAVAKRMLFKWTLRLASFCDKSSSP